MATAVPGARYRHRKGGEYLVTGVAQHTETGEEMVVYRSEADGNLYVRPRSMFEDEGRFKRISGPGHEEGPGT